MAFPNRSGFSLPVLFLPSFLSPSLLPGSQPVAVEDVQRAMAHGGLHPAREASWKPLMQSIPRAQPFGFGEMTIPSLLRLHPSISTRPHLDRPGQPASQHTPPKSGDEVSRPGESGGGVSPLKSLREIPSAASRLEKTGAGVRWLSGTSTLRWHFAEL